MKLAKAKTMYNIRLTNEKIKEIRDKANEMDVYQEDIISDATELYFNLYGLWQDDKKEFESFEEFIEGFF